MTTPQNPKVIPRKNKGLIIGVIVGASLLVLGCIVIASIAFLNGVFKDLNIQGSSDPRKNTVLIQRVESYAGVQKATINCSNPVPWDFQSCVLGIQVKRDISNTQVQDVVNAFIPSVTNGDLGKTPEGIRLTFNDRPYAAPIQ